MTAQPANTDVGIAARIVASVDQATSARAGPGLYRELLRLLAHGEPVEPDRLATAINRPLAEVEQAIARWHDVERDGHGRIIGYGLTLNPTPHRFTVDGHRLYTWCALDTLFFPTVLDRPAQVESPCYATGAPVRLTVEPAAGVTALDPSTAVVSVATPTTVVSVRAEFCDLGHFFADAEAARGWQAEHTGMSVLSVAHAYQAGRPLAEALLDRSRS